MPLPLLQVAQPSTSTPGVATKAETSVVGRSDPSGCLSLIIIAPLKLSAFIAYEKL